jgi:hypothetical protein
MYIETLLERKISVLEFILLQGEEKGARYHSV